MVFDIRPSLRTFLLADAAISSAVGGNRIFPLVLPQDEFNPSIVYNRISGLGDHVMQGASGLTRPRFQIDAYARTHDLANSLADLVKDRLDGFQGLMDTVIVQGVFYDTEQEDFQNDVKLFRVSRDYLIWYNEK